MFCKKKYCLYSFHVSTIQLTVLQYLSFFTQINNRITDGQLLVLFYLAVKLCLNLFFEAPSPVDARSDFEFLSVTTKVTNCTTSRLLFFFCFISIVCFLHPITTVVIRPPPFISSFDIAFRFSPRLLFDRGHHSMV